MINIRAFIGADFDIQTKNYIYDVLQKLRKFAVAGKWKHINNLHLTLKFLGEINSRQQEQIDMNMKQICACEMPLTLDISQLGVFEGRQRESIRVLWIGFSGEISRLTSLSKKIDDSMSAVGMPREKRAYSPHITLGQEIVFDHEFEEIKLMIGEIKFTPILLNSLFLFKSEQINNRRIYTKVSEYNFHRR